MSTSMDIECPDCGALNTVEVDSISEIADLECEECGSPLFGENEDEEWDGQVDNSDVPVPVLQPLSTLPIDSASRLQGLYIIGATGTGKSTLLEHLIIKDIEMGLGVCLIEPHGDITQNVLSRIPAGRENDVVYLDLERESFPFGINLFECLDPTDVKQVAFTSSFVEHVFEKVWKVDPEKTPLLAQYLRNSAFTMINNPGMTFAEVPLLLIDEPVRKRLLAKVSDPQVKLFWQMHNRFRPNDQLDRISSTYNRVDAFLTQPIIRNIVGQSITTIKFRDIMDQGKILLVQLSPRLADISNLVGAMIIGKLLDAAYSRKDTPVAQRRQFHIYADEFQRFAVADFASFFAEARKFGIGLTVAHQWRGQLDQENREATMTVANLMVFRVQPGDAEELAGLFTITPQEAWEEEIEPEWVEIVIPQRHERLEEQVAVEVEDDVKAIINNPIEYLLSVRSAHSSERVTEIIQNPLKKLKEKLEFGSSSETIRRVQKLFSLLNDLLIQVMWGNILIESSLFIKKVLEIARAYDPNNTWGKEPEWEGLLINLFASPELRETIIETYAIIITEERLKEQHKYEQYKEVLEICGERFNVNSSIKKYIILIEAVRDLCVELEKSPITISTGEKKMVKRIQPHITYLTHESEKITHPRQTIMHPQRTYADMLNEVASQLVHLPNYQAKIKIGGQESLIVTDPPQIGLTSSSLQERVETVQANNQRNGYTRPKNEVEQEIEKRQAALLATKDDEPPPRRSSKE